MKKISATTRLAFSLTGLVVSVLLFGNLLGIVPDSKTLTQRARTQLSEAIAIGFAGQATKTDVKMVEATMDAIRLRNPDVSSIAVRQADGVILASSGEHDANWVPRDDGRSTLTQVRVPLGAGNGQWGAVEVTFPSLRESKLPFLARFNPLLVTAGIGLLTFCLYQLYLRFALRALNPSKVVPKRVNDALNTLAEGLLVLDKNQRIVMANKSFVEATGISTQALIGKDVNELPWTARPQGTDISGSGQEEPANPWTRSMANGSTETGVLMEFGEDDAGRTYSVNTVPIADENGKTRGVLASFEDVTQLELKNKEMTQMVDKLRRSAKQINRANRELERLATRDPLTNCLNRRAFFEQAEQVFLAGERYDYPTSVVMLDVDHFKSVNDNHGHAVGDEVLQRVGATLAKLTRESDLVCRYGGEEFCILLPHIDLAGAYLTAERIRVAIEALEFENLSVTASFGATDQVFGAVDVQEMLDQADKCLYAAKRTGRNRVVQFAELEHLDIPEEDGSASALAPVPTQDDQLAIPYRAVTALLAALAFRDRATAEHSRRVADLCVLLSEDLVSRRECYLIEMAALLHDIGKVGVPDSVLLKPGKLTKEEWEVMEKHDLIGSEIIRASFASTDLSQIVESHHYFFGGTPKAPNAPIGNDIPLGARALAIADAYDAITSDRVYRKGQSQEAAFHELRRCANSQFDPMLVEHFIHKMSGRKTQNRVQFGVSKETALGIGLQMERLVAALDDRDLRRLSVLNAELHRTAIENAVDMVAEKSEELRLKLEADEDLIDILYTAGELLEACRSTQTSFFEGSEFRSPVGEPLLN